MLQAGGHLVTVDCTSREDFTEWAHLSHNALCGKMFEGFDEDVGTYRSHSSSTDVSVGAGGEVLKH